MRHTHGESCIQTYLTKHPIFEFFAGIPLVISIVAPLSVFKTLSEIFLYMADKNNDILESRMDEGSLIHCLEYINSYLKERKNSNILELWHIIGMQGPGILYEDLKEIMCNEEDDSEEFAHARVDQMDKMLLEEGTPEPQTEQTKLDKNIEDLISFSLIEQECLDKAGTIRRFRVSPFVD
jgi:hypothetical protein